MGTGEIISLIVGVLGFILAVYSTVISGGRAKTTDLVAAENRLTKIEGKLDTQAALISSLNPRENAREIEAIKERLAAVDTKISVFWKAVSIDAAMMLHSPEPELARRDRLLEKFTYGNLELEEARELAEMLTVVLRDREKKSVERMAASIVLRNLAVEYDLPGVKV